MGDNSNDLESGKSESSMLGVENQSSLINNNVFPPINHEGLDIHSQTFPQSLHHFKPTTSPSKLPTSRTLWLRFMLSSIDYIRSRLLECSFSRIISVPVTVLLFVLWYWRVRRLRQAVLKEARNHLIRIVTEKDEEINKLMRQIAQMNKLLLGSATSSPRTT